VALRRRLSPGVLFSMVGLNRTSNVGGGPAAVKAPGLGRTLGAVCPDDDLRGALAGGHDGPALRPVRLHVQADRRALW
jgi:hypothetical protein